MKTQQTKPRSPRRDCEHCRINPESRKPFLKMKRVSIGDPVFEDLEETAKLRKEPADCFVCDLVADMIGGLEQASRDQVKPC